MYRHAVTRLPGPWAPVPFHQRIGPELPRQKPRSDTKPTSAVRALRSMLFLSRR